MSNIAVRKVRDLDEPARQWITHLFGRNLGDDEEITITLFPPHSAPSAAVRKQAAARLDRILDNAAQNLQGVPEQEFEAAVEEATQQVRPWKT
jgi:hypothetical protein